MGKLSTLILSLLLLGFFSCTDDDENPSSIPACVQEQIDQFKLEQADCMDANIIRYEFQAKKLFAFGEGNCIEDRSTFIIEEDCADFCTLGGTLSNDVCNGEIFFNTAIARELIWQN